MRKKEVISALCQLVTKVGKTKAFEDKMAAHDCFCLSNILCIVDDSIVEFIKQAVEEKIQRQKNQGDSPFPVHFKEGNLKVFSNGSGEVFVENTNTGVYMRINDNKKGLEFTAQQDLVTPFSINGLIGWCVRKW